MANQNDREDALRRIAEHVEETRRRLEHGRLTLDRMRRSVRETREHIGSMADWIDQTERHLQAARREAEQREDEQA